jgi:hypothetical protein
MVAMPADTPVTTPRVPTLAIAVLELLHVPPGVAFARVVVCPTQVTGVPVVGDAGCTTKGATLVHPDEPNV